MGSEQTLRRPALRKFTDDLSELRRELLAGFRSRPALLRWMQTLTVKTLGQVPQRRYHQFGREFVPDADGDAGILVTALLLPTARSRPLEEDVAMELRRDWSSRTIAVARHPAFRALRKDAGDYVGDTDDESKHTAEQEFTAMRPALDELHQYQREALDLLLDGGLPDREAILDWGDTVELAAHGEPVDRDRPAQFIAKCYQEDPTAELLTASGKSFDRAREAFAARWLLPAFNRGVRDLAGRTGEEASTGTDTTDNEPPDWT